MCLSFPIAASGAVDDENPPALDPAAGARACPIAVRARIRGDELLVAAPALWASVPVGARCGLLGRTVVGLARFRIRSPGHVGGIAGHRAPSRLVPAWGRGPVAPPSDWAPEARRAIAERARAAELTLGRLACNRGSE